jgi:GPH family glycoside/pentoside/hexuronide:cation symporter
MVGAIPIAVIFAILWIPPKFFGVGAELYNFIYLLIMLFAYDTFYTMVALPYDSLFPELYTSVKERAQVNSYRQIFSVVGLLGAYLLSGFLIGDLFQFEGYIVNGIVTAITVIITLIVSLKWGVKERAEFKEDHKLSSEMGLFNSLKYTLKNKGFILYTVMFLLYEYILLLLGSVIPLYSEYVLGVSGTIETGIMLALLFLVGLVSIFLVWNRIDKKFGGRKGFFISLLAYWLPTIGLLFINDYSIALIVVALAGPGFGGMLYFIYLIIADVIDEDEIKRGVRREGAFFGVTNFFMRLAGVFSILTITIVFVDSGWEQYVIPVGVTLTQVIFGLRMLVFLFPSIAIGIIILCLYFYPFTEKRVEENKKKLHEIHEEKLKKRLK